MKLRNKKTGDIWEFDGGFSMIASHKTAERAGGRGCSVGCYANSLAELNEDWEDYTPAEPLIKDEKIRKAVRAWAKANGFNTARYSSVNDCFCHQGNMMFVEPSYELEQLDFLGYKTIAELCGEEEKSRPVIVNGAKYDSFADYLKSREEEE